MKKQDVIRVLEWFSKSGVTDLTLNNISSSSNHQINTLAELKTAMEHVDISIKHCAQHMVFGTGNPHSSILLLGEAPGAEEDRQGIPFVGQSGQLLDKALSAIGLNRDKVYITNILPWRPPGNMTPNGEEIALFRPYVLKHIELINPKIVVCLGGTATKALLQSTEGIMRLRGRWASIDEIRARILPTFHPAYLLRSPSQKKEFWHDMLMIDEFLNSEQS